MLSVSWFTSTRRRSSTIEVGSFFFEPLQLDLQSANLLVQICKQGFAVFLLAVIRLREYPLDVPQQLAFPLTDQVAMYGKLAGQLTHRLIAADCCQSHAGFERRIISLPTPSLDHH